MDSLMSVELKRRLETGIRDTAALHADLQLPNIRALAGFLFTLLLKASVRSGARGRTGDVSAQS